MFSFISLFDCFVYALVSLAFLSQHYKYIYRVSVMNTERAYCLQLESNLCNASLCVSDGLILLHSSFKHMFYSVVVVQFEIETSLFFFLSLSLRFVVCIITLPRRKLLHRTASDDDGYMYLCKYLK